MKIIAGILTAIAVVAFVTTFGFAYVGAATDSIHAWQVCEVSLFLTAITGGAAAIAWSSE